VIATIGGVPPTLAAKAATSTIPIAFGIGPDPVELGLVASLNRTGGNMTGVAVISDDLTAKRVELLHDLAPQSAKMAPQVSTIAVLLNPRGPIPVSQSEEVENAAHSLGLRLVIYRASTDNDLAAAFAAIGKAQTGALLIVSDSFFNSKREKLAAEAIRHMLPAISDGRQFPDVGGLMSYGTSLINSFHQVRRVYGPNSKGC
jgi:putative tryptophan/tyrosine transport system substrate-binding protein